MTKSRSGKMPTTSVRRRISLFNRSWGLLDQICRHASREKAVNASSVAGIGQMCCGSWEFGFQGVDDAVELGSDLFKPKTTDTVLTWSGALRGRRSSSITRSALRAWAACDAPTRARDQMVRRPG